MKYIYVNIAVDIEQIIKYQVITLTFFNIILVKNVLIYINILYALITAHFTQKEKWISMFFNYSEAWVRSEFDRYMENCKDDEERSKLQKAFNDAEEHLMK